MSISALPEPNVTLVHVLRGHAAAIRLVQAIVAIFHVWDDLVDRDRTPSEEEIDQAFWLALVDIPSNPFYQAHIATFQPIIQMGTLSWWAATRAEREGTREEREVAFATRSQIAEVTTAAAALIGGVDWAREVGPMIKRLAYLDSGDDSLAAYMAELEKRDGMV